MNSFWHFIYCYSIPPVIRELRHSLVWIKHLKIRKFTVLFHGFLLNMSKPLCNSRYSSWIRPKNLTVRVLQACIQQRRGQGGSHASAMCVEESGGMVKETLGHSAITIWELNMILIHPCCRTKEYRRLGTKVGECESIFGLHGKPATQTAAASGPGTGLP